MSKLNRREYLKQMGAASAIVGISNLLSPSSYSAAVKHSERRLLQPQRQFLFTPTTPTAPTRTNLTVLFGGLMAFSNTQDRKAQVGFQKGNGNHKLHITVCKIIGSDCVEIRSFTHAELASVEKIELDVLDQPANVDFFHKDNFKRLPDDDAKDFGWVLDFEDFPLHPSKVKITKKFSPVLQLSQGTFYTHKLTQSKFDLIDESVGAKDAVVQEINQLPLLVGAAIDIPVDKKAILKFQKFNGTVEEVPLSYAVNVRYEIRIVNECFHGSSHCKWEEPSHPDEDKRNDFYMHYLMFTPNDGKRYGVSLKPPPNSSSKRRRSSKRRSPEDIEGNDEAPCMGAGLSGKTSF